MPSARTPLPEPQCEFIKDSVDTDAKATKRAKDKQNAAAMANKQGRKASEAIAKGQKRSMRRHVQRKSRVRPLTRSAASGRGNAQTRRRKESRD